MKEIDKIFGLVDKLKDLFCYHSGVLQYDDEVQNEINILIDKLAEITGTYATNIKREITNIKEELTIIDKNSGKSLELVDIDSMAQRVKNINQSNNMHSCLKTLALSNKIAHIYDGNLESCKRKFIEYFNIIFPNNTIDNIHFMEKLDASYPEIQEMSIYNCDKISDKDFKGIWDLLSGKKSNIKKKVKISLLNSFNVECDKSDDNDIDSKFTLLCSKKDYIGASYLKKKFEEGNKLVRFQNNMFAIKNYYISMIGQLLCNEFSDVPYQLIKTADATKGFEHMLIIDDKDLSYYIEVHMPNYIATKLINTYGLKSSEERIFKKLGSSAVYYRDSDEIRRIIDAIRSNTLNETTRSQIISRDYHDYFQDDGSVFSHGDFKDVDLSAPISSDDSVKASSYQFITDEISDKPMLIEIFLQNVPLYKNIVNEYRLSLLNENYSIEESKNIAKKMYEYLYNNFDNDYKEKFIDFSLDELSKGDIFDKKLYKKIKENLTTENIDSISKMIINSNEIKDYFLKENQDLKKYFDIKKKNFYSDRNDFYALIKNMGYSRDDIERLKRMISDDETDDFLDELIKILGENSDNYSFYNTIDERIDKYLNEKINFYERKL